MEITQQKSRLITSQNQPGLPNFSRVTLKNMGRPGDKAKHNTILCTCVHYSLTTKHEYHYKGHEPYKQLLHSSSILSFIYSWLRQSFPLPIPLLVRILFFIEQKEGRERERKRERGEIYNCIVYMWKYDVSCTKHRRRNRGGQGGHAPPSPPLFQGWHTHSCLMLSKNTESCPVCTNLLSVLSQNC